MMTEESALYLLKIALVVATAVLILFVATCTVGVYVADDLATIDAGEFRGMANRQLPVGSSEQEVIAFMERIASDPPEKATTIVQRRAQPAAEFGRSTDCLLSGDCVLGHVDPSSAVLFLRLDNTRGGVFPCDGGGVYVYFVLDHERRLVETVTEDFEMCL